jgi:hypothetical protein
MVRPRIPVALNIKPNVSTDRSNGTLPKIAALLNNTKRPAQASISYRGDRLQLADNRRSQVF